MSEQVNLPDWNSVNWERNNYEIADELNCPLVVVSYYRTLVGKPKWQCGKVDWKTVDWDKNDQQISEEHRVTLAKVRLAREIVGHAPLVAQVNGRVSRIITPEMISVVDWQKTKDAELARTWHVSRERVRQIRQEGGHPVCLINSVDTLSQEFERWMIENRTQIEGKLASVVANDSPSPLPKNRKYELMRRTSIPFVWTNKRGGNQAQVLPINWDIPNCVLDMIWDKSSNWTANQRSRFSMPQQKWKHCYRTNGKPGHCTTEELVQGTPELQEAIKVEIDKALKIGITPRWEVYEMVGLTNGATPQVKLPGLLGGVEDK